MKKKFSMLLIIAISSLCSCNKNKTQDNIVPCDRFVGLQESFEDLTFDEINNKLSSRQSFILTTYNNTCLCSTDFYNNLWNPLIKETNILTYKTSSEEFSKIANLTFTPNTPDIVFIQKGEIVGHINAYEKYNNESKNINKLKEDISHYFSFNSPMIQLTIEQLDDKINKDESFLVYYSYNACPDCSAFNELFLNKWLLDSNNKNKTIYQLESSLYRSDTSFNQSAVTYLNAEPSVPLWSAIKDRYGLSEAGSATYGYTTGVVPTLQYYENGELKGSAVIFNDSFTQNNNGIKITSGFYHEFDNKEFNSIIDYRADTATFYGSKFQEIVNKKY